MQNELTLSYPLIAIGVFARQLCLPVPAVLFLIAAGAMVRDGELHLPVVLAMSVLGCLGGDLVWFEAGRRWGRRILRIFTSFSQDPRRTSQKAHSVFSQWGLRSLLVAKFVPGLDGITPPLAGLEGSSRSSFLLYDGMGSLLWSLFYVLGGLLFAKQINGVLAAIQNAGSLLAVLVLLPFVAFVVWRAVAILQMARRLRMKRISALLLHAKLTAGETVVVVDLLNFQEGARPLTGIEGAVRIHPERLRSRAQIIVPAGLRMVLYCGSSDQFRSARVAMALKRKGVTEVWVLEGGLSAWVNAGLPVSDQLLSEDDAIRRFGLQVLDGRRPTQRSAQQVMPATK